jgi:hypothetical protein
MRKTLIALLAAVLLGAAGSVSAWWGGGWNPYSPWDPRYWMEEFFGGGWGGGPWGYGGPYGYSGGPWGGYPYYGGYGPWGGYGGPWGGYGYPAGGWGYGQAPYLVAPSAPAAGAATR